jgi:hypothetical protein
MLTLRTRRAFATVHVRISNGCVSRSLPWYLQAQYRVVCKILPLLSLWCTPPETSCSAQKGLTKNKRTAY